MYKEIDVHTWKRKDIFNLYKTYDDPYFNVTFNVDVSQLYRFCRSNKSSFFLCSLYLSTKVANGLDGFKLRFKEGKVVCYNKIDCGSTILLGDNTFTFCYFDYVENRDQFVKEGMNKIENAKAISSFEPKDQKDDLLHYSVLPWLAFTSFKNARRKNPEDAIPKILFGKVHDLNAKKYMPVSVELHHAMADGYDVGQYYELFQKALHSIR